MVCQDMTKYATVYLKISKERAANILNDELRNFFSGVHSEEEDGDLKLYTNKKGYWVVSLYDADSGRSRTKMNYRTTSGNAGKVGRKAKETLEDYVI